MGNKGIKLRNYRRPQVVNRGYDGSIHSERKEGEGRHVTVVALVLLRFLFFSFFLFFFYCPRQIVVGRIPEDFY